MISTFFLSSLALHLCVPSLRLEQQDVDKPAFAAIGIRAYPEECKMQIEMETTNENCYRLTLKVSGKTNFDVRDLVTKELKRHHWDAEAKASGLIFVRGYLPEGGALEPIKAITITVHANDNSVVPPYPAISHGENVSCKVVIIQQHPYPMPAGKP